MVRAAAATPSKRKEKESAALSAEDKAEDAESKRLRDLALSCKLLSRSRSHAHHPSLPSKTILKSDGRDIVKKGHRKSKYLFAFPGLLSPVSGGKLGELTNLDSKNPVLYIEFPQGRLKMFGTITYPKNKYLTLHFPRGGGNIVCEDCFESLIVFSQAWWIGTKEQNPEEVRLPLPKSLEQEKNTETDFTAGAGQTKDFNKNRNQLEKSEATPPTASMAKPEISEAESTGKDSDTQVVNQSVRQSARTAGRTLKYADSSSDSDDSNSDESERIPRTRGKMQSPKELADVADTNAAVKSGTIVDIDDFTPKKETTRSEEGIPDFKPVAAAAKTPRKVTDSKLSILKQSRIESFCRLDPVQVLNEATSTVANMETTVDSKDEVTTSVVKASIKSTKRSRKAFEEETGGPDSDNGNDGSHVVKETHSKHRKQAKSEQGIGITKVSTPKGKSSPSSKVQGRDGRAKQQKISKERKPASGAKRSAANTSIPKGRKNAASGSHKPSKQKSDTEDEDSDSDGENDDSDEDYVG